MGARQHDLRALGLLANVVDVGAHPVADLEILTRDRLVATHDSFAAAQIDDDVSIFDALCDAVHDLADPVLELFVLPLAFRLTHLARDNLPGHLGLNAAKFERRQDLGVGLAGLRILVAAQSVRKTLLSVLVDLLGVVADHRHDARNRRLTGLGVDVHADVMFGAVPGAAAFWIASSMASTTISFSIDFSRATASAICRSSKRLAEMPVTVISLDPYAH